MPAAATMGGMPQPYRSISPDPVESATGTSALVFAQSRRELGAPFAPHLSAVPELHAATWALLRESTLAGAAPRARKEAAAANGQIYTNAYGYAPATPSARSHHARSSAKTKHNS